MRTLSSWLLCIELAGFVTLPAAAAGTAQDRAVTSAAIQCANMNSAQSTLPRDVGLKDAKTRRNHIAALVTALRRSATKVGTAETTVEGTATATKLLAIRKAMLRYAQALSVYLRVVPVATTAMDTATVNAFGGLINTGSALTARCGSLAGRR